MRPIKIACGGNHTFMLLEDQHLWVTGDNSQGQCGTLESSKTSQWVLLPGLFKDIACGWEYSIVITEDNKVLSIGFGPKGQLGIRDVKHSLTWNFVMSCSSDNPKLYSSFQNCLVQDGNKVYGWGPNRQGQLHDSTNPYHQVPILIYEGKNITQITVGKNFTCLLDHDTLIFKGTLKKIENEIIQQLNQEKIIKISAMWSSLSILTQSRLLSFGQGIHGQLFSDDLPKGVTDMCTGSEHGILSLGNSTVMCWGWGEHGNCGVRNEYDRRDFINDKSNIISPLNEVFKQVSSKKIWIFGGCATTWICMKC